MPTKFGTEVLPASYATSVVMKHGPALYKFKIKIAILFWVLLMKKLYAINCDEIKSYKKLPLTVYVFRQSSVMKPITLALLRTREFIMKDAYSFSADQEGLDEAFHNMESLHNIFDRLGSVSCNSWRCWCYGWIRF